MSEVIPLPFTLFPRPGTPYEVFWNSEHVHLYEVHFSLPLNERNLHVQQRWALIRSVQKQLADKNFSADALSTLKLKIQVAIREASMLRSARAALLVDHKGVPCDAQRAVRLRIEKNGHPRADSHWLSELNALLTKLSSAGETMTAKGAEPRPETPPKRTLRDYFTPPALTIPPATLERFFASPRSSPSSSNPPTERICPVMGTLPEPSPQYLSHEETLVSFVESIARDQGISATGALDHILHTARGNEVSSLKESPPLPRLPARIRTAISAMLRGVYSSGPTCGVNEVCRPVTVQGTSQATPAMGDCALYGLLFVGLPLLRPPSLHPEAAAAVCIWAVRQMIRGMVPPVPMQEEVLHLQGLEPRTVVRLGHLLGVYCTVVQDLDGVFYIVAEPDVPYGSGMHAVLLQTTDHYTTFSPPLTNAQPVLVPSSPIMSQASTDSEAQRAPATLDLYAALNVSASPLWRKTQLHVLLQELCAHVAKQVSEKKKPKRQKVAHSFKCPPSGAMC